jgi:hypothetical protein
MRDRDRHPAEIKTVHRMPATALGHAGQVGPFCRAMAAITPLLTTIAMRMASSQRIGIVDDVFGGDESGAPEHNEIAGAAQAAASMSFSFTA